MFRCVRYLSRSRGKSVRANTLESSLQIRTRPVATNVRVILALVLVPAFLAGRVQNVTGGTLAPVRPVRVYALAAVARVRHKRTFVQILALVAAADAFRTQFRKRLYGRGPNDPSKQQMTYKYWKKNNTLCRCFPIYCVSHRLNLIRSRFLTGLLAIHER